MLRDIEAGKIDIVVTKDLSRLGRNYVQTGFYIEEYFPKNHVRYIALNDSVDTTLDNNDIAPFKNILNEFYSRDVSKKIRSARQIAPPVRSKPIRAYSAPLMRRWVTRKTPISMGI